MQFLLMKFTNGYRPRRHCSKSSNYFIRISGLFHEKGKRIFVYFSRADIKTLVGKGQKEGLFFSIRLARETVPCPHVRYPKKPLLGKIGFKDLGANRTRRQTNIVSFSRANTKTLVEKRSERGLFSRFEWREEPFLPSFGFACSVPEKGASG